MEWILLFAIAAGGFWLYQHRKRKDELRIATMMYHAAAAGEKRKIIDRAIESLNGEKSEATDPKSYCVSSVLTLVKAFRKLFGKNPDTEDADEQFVIGIFAMVTSDIITQQIGPSFEEVSTAVLVILSAPSHQMDDRSNYLGEITHAYNRMNVEGRTTEAIGKTIVAWIDDPSHERLEKLRELYVLCYEGVR